MQIEMNTLEQTTTPFWAWANKDFNTVNDFALHYNQTAEAFGEEKLHPMQIILLGKGLEVPTSKWVFRIRN